MFPQVGHQRSISQRSIFTSRSQVVSLLALFAAGVLAAQAAPPPPSLELPSAVVDSAEWRVLPLAGNVPLVVNTERGVALSTGPRPLTIATVKELELPVRLRVQLRVVDSNQRSSLQVSAGLSDPADLKQRGTYVSLVPSNKSLTWVAYNPRSKERLPETRGVYRPQFHVERSLSWPELLRSNVEADMAQSPALESRRVVLDIDLREGAYDLSLDGIPLASIADEGLSTRGFARLTLSPHLELFHVKQFPAAPADPNWVFRPVPLESVVNASSIDGHAIDRAAWAPQGTVDRDGVPFQLPTPDADGNDHVDLGVSWFRQGNVTGRYSGRGGDPLTARWAGALIKDPTRVTLRLPMARYRALHLLAAADSDADSVPVVTAQFFRAQSGFPKNFAARVPAFEAQSKPSEALRVKTRSGGTGSLFHVTIPIDAGALAEFDDLDYVDVELTKEVQLYRASPDPMYYSQHAAGLPSSVHIFALTAERGAVDVQLEANAFAHLWTAPEVPRYEAKLTARTGVEREVRATLETSSLDGLQASRQERVVRLTPGREATIAWELKPASYGLHDVRLTIVDGEQTHVESRSLAYLHTDTRERGNWDFGRGPLFGFWNWGGAHHTPPAARQLEAMAKAGIESTPGSFEEYTARHGDEARQVMEQYRLFTLKFAGAGDHYVTARFAADLKKLGLDEARETFVKTLNERKSAPGPNSRPMFLSFYAEPSIGPLTHGIFPHFIGEPDQPLSPLERERYELFLNGFVEGSKIVRQYFPQVKCLLPHGDPAFTIHFLRQNPEIAQWLDGVCVDIPCFERLPEQQFHQVSLHRLYMTRRELTAAGVTKPFLPMYEGPCIPSGPGALTDQEQADLTIRSSLLLLVYGVDVQNGGFPAFDTASYWGEQHYGFGVLNRVSLETPKVAYAAVATLTRHLNRANFERWLPTGSLNTFALQFKHFRTGRPTHVLWTLRGQRPVTITASAGENPVVFDQMDNPLPVQRDGDKLTFTLKASPCYVEGWSGATPITLGSADHSDTHPAEVSNRVANLGDGTWSLSTQPEAGYEGSHTPYIYRYPSPMTAQAVEAPASAGGRALGVHFPTPEKDRVFVPYYSVLTPKQPIVIPGKASHLGLWVRAQGDWGRVVYFLRDAKGEQWISVGTRGDWNCDDLHSWTSFNFDGWRYLRMELPAHSPYDLFREGGNAWWGPYSSGDETIDLPLAIEKIVIERRTHVMYVNDPQPADPADVLLGDVIAEYRTPTDQTPEAVRLSTLRMPVPQDVRGLDNPLERLAADGVHPPLKIERITLPTQEADGTQCYVHFPTVADAKHYDVWAAPYEDGRGALQLGKLWKEPGLLVRGLRPNRRFYLFVTYTKEDGSTSRPSAPFAIELEDFFGMK